ncbi:MAG TPA: hypothetical protein EYP08_07345 [Pyrodictiaceae archaeon]|nr:hypothetical protein [Pyrodictiaceae archaeon]
MAVGQSVAEKAGMCVSLGADIIIVGSNIIRSKDVREEDYAFLAEHCDTDEFCMPWAPQLLAELDDGRIVVLLSKMPFDEKTLKFDVNRALEIVMEKIKGLE